MKATERSVKVTIEVTSVTGDRMSESYFISVDSYRRTPGKKTMLAMLSEKFFSKLESLNSKFYPFLQEPEA